VASKLGDRKNRHDVFHQRAKKEGFAARAVYKLEEIDARYALFRPGGAVLDLGCRPGSWLQYAARRVGDRGPLVGIDREALPVVIPTARIIIGDVFTVTPGELAGDLPAFDTVLSDMAPDTSGVRSQDQARSEALFERALELAEILGAPGSVFVGKLVQGPDFQKLILRCRTTYSKVAPFKPKGSRPESAEQYIVCLGKKTSCSPW
jgi:23S rRNA (uridine2552-2'-O)-methyltransferase